MGNPCPYPENPYPWQDEPAFIKRYYCALETYTPHVVFPHMNALYLRLGIEIPVFVGSK
jgi:hypothetical protein